LRVTSALSEEHHIKAEGEDATLLELYALAGEECGELIILNPRIVHRIRRYLPALSNRIGSSPEVPDIEVRELLGHEMRRAEEELWIHDHQQKADTTTDRVFAAFTGTLLAGVARCSRFPDGFTVDGVYVLEEYRHRGFARQIMRRLIEECGRDGALYLYAKPEHLDFYRDMGFETVPESGLPATIRAGTPDRSGVSVCPMKRDPTLPAGDLHE
jgi:GNAT superfamily N-acetyltransferase